MKQKRRTQFLGTHDIKYHVKSMNIDVMMRWSGREYRIFSAEECNSDAFTSHDCVHDDFPYRLSKIDNDKIRKLL